MQHVLIGYPVPSGARADRRLDVHDRKLPCQLLEVNSGRSA
jgi:hypothetical protein